MFTEKGNISVERVLNHLHTTTDSGKVYVWGKREKGQLGLGVKSTWSILGLGDSQEEYKTPTLIPPKHFNNEPVVCVAMGCSHTAFLTSMLV